MNPRLLTSAVVIHATACFVAIFAVGPRQADASFDFLNNGFINHRPHVIPQPGLNPGVEPGSDSGRDSETLPTHDTEILKSHPNASRANLQNIAASQKWDEATFDSQLEATSDLVDDSVQETSFGGEVVVALPLLVH